MLTNAHTRIRLEDARTVLKLSPQNYDVIVSEPSNPWFASIGSVFSRQFYEIAAARLRPGGLMVQWFHVYEMHDGIVDLVLRTFQSVFPVVEIWDTNAGDIILIGSAGPWNYSLESLRRAYGRELVRQDLASIGLSTPEALLARQFASQRTAFAIAGSGPIQSDGFPVLEYEAPLAFYIGTIASKIARFDERTWQSGFVSAEKRNALVKLSDESLRAAFTNSTINAELGRALASRLQPRRTNSPAASGGPASAIPCLFKVEMVPVEDQFPAKASDELKELFRARAALQRGDGDCAEPVQTIRRILVGQLAASAKRPLDKSGGHFAGVAARACMINRQFGLAKEMLSLGFKFFPDEPELGFLARLLEREAGGKG